LSTANVVVFCYGLFVGPHAAPFDDDDEARQGGLWTNYAVALRNWSLFGHTRNVMHIFANVGQPLLPASLYIGYHIKQMLWCMWNSLSL